MQGSIIIVAEVHRILLDIFANFKVEIDDLSLLPDLACFLMIEFGLLLLIHFLDSKGEKCLHAVLFH